MNGGQPVVRRFYLADGMIVIAALAATFALAKVMPPDIADFREAYDQLTHLSKPYFVRTHFDPVRRPWLRIGHLVEMAILTWMIACAAIRLRHPSLPIRAVLLQPGMVVLWAVATAFAFGLLVRLVGGDAADGVPVLVVKCLAVPVAWGALKATRRWRPEASRLERFNRTLGYCWWTVTWISVAFLDYLIVRYWWWWLWWGNAGVT